MATIDSVKLPDNSTYDLTDNYSGYAKKVAGATTDDLASLTATGDLADSGKKLSDLVLKSDVKDVLNSTSTTDPLSANQGRVLEEQAEAMVNVYGAKNLNSYPYYHGNRYTNGITFTDNGDGTITATGTAIADAMFAIHSPNITEPPIIKVPNGNYILTGCPSVSGCDIRLLQAAKNTGITEILGSDTGDGVTFTIDGGYYSDNYSVLGMRIYVANGTALPVGGITFKPMIRDARITDPTYEPYAKTNQQLTANVSGLSNRNLLDNPWFTVNQRGVSGTHYQDYMADRWDSYGFAGTQISTNTLSNGIRIQSGSTEGWRAMQNIENYKMLSGKVVTLSINIISANPTPAVWLYSTSPGGQSGTWEVIGTSTTTGISSFTFTLPDLSSATGLCIALQGVESQDITIRAVKLELGTVSTLALDVAPDYTTELLKCQRYFERIKLLGSANSYALFGIGYADSTAVARVIIWCQPKRTLPTLSFTGSFYLGTNAVTGMTAQQMTNAGIAANVASSGLVQNDLYVLTSGNTGYYIDLSADL